MPATNQYYRPMTSPYVSQYADYKLPYEAIQNAVMQRQGKFDTMQSMPGQMAAQFGSLSSRTTDAEGVQSRINDYLGNVNQTVEDKFGGDWSLAGGEIYNKTAEFTADPMWKHVSNAYQQQQQHQQARQAASAQGLDYYTFNAGDDPGNRLDPDNISIFNEDGTLNDVQYRGATRIDQRPIYEKYFDNKKASTPSARRLVEQIESVRARTGQDDAAFLALVKEQGVSFSDGYIDRAADQYINNEGLDYRIYRDQGFSHDDAKKLVIGNMVSAAEEREFYQADVQPLSIPQYRPPSGGGKEGPVGGSITTDQHTTHIPLLEDKDGNNVPITSITDANKALRQAMANGDMEKVQMINDLKSETSSQLLAHNPKAKEAYDEYEQAVERTLTPIVDANISLIEDQGFEFENEEAKSNAIDMLHGVSNPDLANADKTIDRYASRINHGVSQFMNILKMAMSAGPVPTEIGAQGMVDYNINQPAKFGREIMQNAEQYHPDKTPQENIAAAVALMSQYPQHFGLIDTRGDGQQFLEDIFGPSVLQSFNPLSSTSGLIVNKMVTQPYQERVKAKLSPDYKEAKKELSQAYDKKQRFYDEPFDELLTSESQGSVLDINLIDLDGKWVDQVTRQFNKNIGDDYEKDPRWDIYSEELQSIVAEQMRGMNYGDAMKSDKSQLRLDLTTGEWQVSMPVAKSGRKTVARIPLPEQYQDLMYEGPVGQQYNPLAYGPRQKREADFYAGHLNQSGVFTDLKPKLMTKVEAASYKNLGENPRFKYTAYINGQKDKTLTYGDLYKAVEERYAAALMEDPMGARQQLIQMLQIENDDYPFANKRGMPFMGESQQNKRPVYFNDPLLFRIANLLSQE